MKKYAKKSFKNFFRKFVCCKITLDVLSKNILLYFTHFIIVFFKVYKCKLYLVSRDEQGPDSSLPDVQGANLAALNNNAGRKLKKMFSNFMGNEIRHLLELSGRNLGVNRLLKGAVKHLKKKHFSYKF